MSLARDTDTTVNPGRRGSLKTEPAHQVILELCREKRTGALVFEAKGQRRELVFRQGQVWGVRVDRLEEAIPAQLGLDTEVYASLLIEMIERGTPFRLALSRVLGDADLNQRLKSIHHKRLVETLGWEEGEFCWFEGERFTEGAQDPIDAYQAVLEAIEAQGTRPAHHMLRTRRHRLIRKTDRFDALKKLLWQQLGEGSVAALLEEKPRSYFDLVNAGIDADRAARQLRALLALGVVEFEQAKDDAKGKEELPLYVASLAARAREESDPTLRITASRRVEEAKRLLTELSERPRDSKLLAAVRAILRDAEIFDGYFEIAERERKVLEEGRSGKPLAALYREVGGVWAKKLFRVDEAAYYLNAALELEPEDPASRALLKEIYLDAGEVTQALELDSGSVARAPSDSKKAAILLSQARLLFERGQGLSAARDLLLEAARLRPDDVEITELLVRLEAQDPDPEARMQAAQRLGRLAELSTIPPRRDLEKAREYIERALALYPTSGPLLELAEKIARSKGDHEATADVLAEALCAATDARSRAEIRKRLAALPLGVARTREHLEAILFDKASPDDVRAEALSGLRTLLGRVGEQGRFAFFLEEEIAREEGSARSVPHTLELAQLYARSLEDPARAVAVLENLLLAEPEHAEVVGALRGLGRQAGWSSVARLLAKSAIEGRWKNPKDPNRIKRLEEAARLMEERVLDPARASALWRRLEDLDPGATQPKEAIRRIEAKVALLQGVLQAMSREVEAAQSPQQKAQALKRLAMAYYEQGHDAARAIGALARAWEIIPGDREVVSKLEALYQEVEDWDGVARILYHRLGSAADPKERYDILWRYAQVCEERIGRPDAAASALSEILVEHPEDSFALARLERLYYRTQDFGAYLSARARRAALSQDPVERGAIYAEMAELCERQMGDRERAVELWRWSLDSRPNDRRARLSLARLLSALGRFEELCELYEVWAKDLSLGHPRRVALLRQAAQLARERLRDVDREQRLLLLVSEEDPEDGEAFARLAEIAFARGDVAGWYEAGQRMLTCRVARPNWGQRVRELGLALAKAHEADGREDEALAILRDLSRGIAAGDRTILDALARLELRAGEPKGAIWAKERSLRRAPEAARAEISGEIAEIWDRIAGGLSGKILALRRVLELRPQDPGLWDSLREAYSAQGEWLRVLEISGRRLRLTKDPRERVALLHEISRIEEESLGDPEAALATLRRAFEEHPEIPETFSVLVSALQARGRGKDLVALYRAAARREEPEEAVRLLHEAAQIEENLCQNPEAALALMKETFEAYPEVEASSQVLLAALERQERYEELAGVYLRLAERAASKQRVSFLLKAAKICADFLKDPERELEILYQAYRQYPQDSRTLPALSEALANLSRWEDLLSLYQEIFQTASDEETRLQAVEQMARICREELGDLRRTFLVKRQALRLDRRDDLALAELEEIAFEAEAYDDLCQLYADLAEHAPHPSWQASFLARKARVHEEWQGDREAALASWFEAFRASPDDEQIIEELKRLGEETGSYEPLFKAYLLRRSAAKSVSLAERLRYTLLAAEVAEKHLPDLPGAFELYLDALRMDPSQKDTRDALRRIAQEISAIDEDPLAIWRRLAEVFAHIAQSGDVRVRVDFLRELAEIQNDVMRDPETAMSTLELALKLDPDRDDSADQLEDYARNAAALPRAWASFLREAELSDSGETTHRLLLRVAKLREEIGDVVGAVEILRRVMSLAPQDSQAVSRLEALLAGAGRYEELIEHHEAIAASLRPGPARRERLLAIAQLWEEKLQKPEEALLIYKRLLAADPQDTEVFKALSRLYEELGEWRNLADLLVHRAQIAPEEAASLYRRAGGIFAERLRLYKNATLAYEAAISQDAQDKHSLSMLAQLYERQQRWADVVKMLLELSRLTPGSEAVPFLIRRAEILSSRLNDPAGARGALEEALSRGPRGDAEREVKTRLAHIRG